MSVQPPPPFSSPPSSANARGAARAPASLSQTVDVETPELVVFSYTIAGVGSRALAAVIDSFVIIALIFSLLLTLAGFASTQAPTGPKPGVFDAWGLAIMAIAIFCVQWGYYIVFEGVFDGQTLGKRLLRLRVVRDGGYSVNFGASAIRNLVRFIDLQPFGTYGVGMLSVIFSKQGKRLGDIVAGTIVVREALVRQLAPPQSKEPTQATPALETLLTEDEYIVLERFIERRGALDQERRSALAAQLASRLASALPAGEPSFSGGSTDLARLVRLYDAERAARAHGAAARQQRGAARERNVLIAT
ncbi:MAG TPA: RDD family protein, partial [Gemmatimonadaceae bacterium]|nr:RDD family protein [Gemmatimonadaceae bacterium]